MPQVQSSLNGAATPPVVMRTSTSGAILPNSASRGISQRIAKVGPTPTVSTGLADSVRTWSVRFASASKIAVSPA
jgi:hypothetical protein